jgi:hypothetical protein
MNDTKVNNTHLTTPKLPQAFPPELDSPEFHTTYEQWTKYRKEKKKELTETTIQMQLKRLAKAGVKRAIELLERSMANGWIGFDFDGKENGSAHGPRNSVGQRSRISAQPDSAAIVTGRTKSFGSP